MPRRRCSARAGGSIDDIAGILVGDVAQSGAADAIAIVEEYAGTWPSAWSDWSTSSIPERVVVSGGLVELDDVLLAPLRLAFDGRIEGAAHRPAVPIVPPSSAGVRVWSAPRCWPGSSCERATGEVARLTLPSFRDDVATSLAVAQAAEASGLDGVFAYDHLFRRNAAGQRRPAIEMFALMGAVAGATTRITVGSLVARATLRPPAMLANGFDTLARILGPERLLVAIGAGDGQSQEENESFGLDFGTVADRIAALRDAVDATRDRGYPVWIGGSDPAVREVAAAHADGWNRWGNGVERFRRAGHQPRDGRGPTAVHGDVGWAGGAGRRRRRRRGEGRTSRGGRPRDRRWPRHGGERAARRTSTRAPSG